jgi:polyisoprenoid-binding protein YceI
MLRTTLALIVLATLAAATAQTFEVIAPSEARYRVRERVLGVWLPSTVGSTSAVSGAVTFDVGVVLPGAAVRVEAARIRSDQLARDASVRRDTLHTDEHPLIVFEPLRVVGLPAPLPSDGLVEISILGDLAIRGVVRQVTWAGSVRFDGDLAEIEAATSFTFDDFELPKPRLAGLVVLDDVIVLEVSLRLRRR